jgi:membrane protein
MSHATGDKGHVDRLRALAEGVAGRIGGVPAVRTLVATLAVYDRAGGGLVAGGLAYAALVALLPGLLLVVSIFGLLISDPATREALVALIAAAVPPLEDFARTAFEQVSAGAVPLTVVGAIGLLWGASRFYAALDYALSRAFHGARRRNEVERTLRGVLLTGLLVLLPLAALLATSLAGWLQERAPGWVLGSLLQLTQPAGSFVLFLLAAVLVYRFVPPTTVPRRAYVPPAVLVGAALAVFTQLFGWIAPMMTRPASVYGAVVAVFALLAWLSISFNVLLLGAAWTRVRALAVAQPARHASAAKGGGEAGSRP